MNNSTQWFLYTLLLVISLALAYWLYNNFAWVSEEKDVGFQGVAQTNNMLAAEFFLRKMGIATQQVNSLGALRKLPSTQHTLLISTQRETLNRELNQLLKSWIRAGGHVIVEARYVSEKDILENKQHEIDPLLDELSVYSTSNKADYGKNDQAAQFVLPLDNSQAEIKVHFPHYRVLTLVSKGVETVQPDWVVSDELGQYLMQFTLGDGLLTIINRASIFSNSSIDKNDNARLLHYLTQLPGHDAGVWLIRIDDMPALWNWLWQNAWYAMFCLSVLLGLWLWRAPLRFGPIYNDRQTERRSLLEHIRASAYYRWHEDQSGLLLAQVQESLWEKIQLNHPVVRRENPSQAFAMLADITNIKESLIKQAFTPVQEIKEQEFTRQIRILENIRKHL